MPKSEDRLLTVTAVYTALALQIYPLTNQIYPFADHVFL